MNRLQNFLILLLCAIGVIIGAAIPLALVYCVFRLSSGQGHLVLGKPLLVFFVVLVVLSTIGNILMYVRKKRYYSKKRKNKKRYGEV